MFEQAKVLSHSGGGSRRLLVASLLAMVLLAIPFFAFAHPLGNFSVNRYSRLELASQQITLFYVLDMAEIPTFQEQPAIDRDENGTISEPEEEQYLASLLKGLQSNLHLEVDGMPLLLQAQSQSLAFPAGQGGLQTMRLEARFVATLPAQEAWQVAYRDENYPQRLGWQEIVLQSAEGIEITDTSVPTEDISQELRVYPDDLLQSPLDVSEATFAFQLGGASDNSATASQSVVPVMGIGEDLSQGTRDQFQLIATQFPRSSEQAFGLGTFVLALMAAFGFGAAHALTPGHGKAIVGAYLVGSRGTMRHAIFLGLTTTITHTAGVFALGFITLFLSQYILPEQLYPWLELFSGLLVVGIGFSMFGQRLREFVNPNLVSHEHGHHHHDHDHSHDHAHHHHNHSHHHSHLPPGTDGEAVTWRNLLALGISGGILPCPSALLVLLSAIALQRVGIGLLLIVAFSVGLASVLTGIGILMVHAGRLFERIPIGGRALKALPVASAFVITIVGLGLTLQALAQTGILQTIIVASSGLF